MKRRTGALPESTATPAAAVPSDAIRQPIVADQHSDGGRSTGAPVVLLSYSYSGAPRVQELIAGGTELACTIGTGIVPLCFGAAESWQRVEGREGQVMSQLAIVSVRNLVSAQISMILAGAGKKRWCELAMADQNAAQRFLQVVPQAVFVCVHRGCLDMIRVAVASSPWGRYGQQFAPYLLSYPGNSVAALAAYWATWTEELLSFEDANPQISRGIRYEDTIAKPGEVLTELRAWLRLGRDPDAVFLPAVDPGEPGRRDEAGSEDAVFASGESEVPVEMIPPPLRQRISRIHARLGYAPLAE